MSDRDPFSERLSEYLDGELSPTGQLEIEDHLAGCATCREELDGLRRTIHHLDRAPDRAPGHDLWPAIQEGLESSEPESSAHRRRPLMVAASLALLTVAAWTAYRVALHRDATATEPEPAIATRASDDVVLAYREAVEDWHEVFDGARWPVDLDAELRAQAEAFDRAVDETTAALRRSPTDAELRAYLVETLRAQMRFLSRVGPIGQEVS